MKVMRLRITPEFLDSLWNHPDRNVRKSTRFAHHYGTDPRKISKTLNKSPKEAGDAVAAFKEAFSSISLSVCSKQDMARPSDV